MVHIKALNLYIDILPVYINVPLFNLKFKSYINSICLKIISYA